MLCWSLMRRVQSSLPHEYLPLHHTLVLLYYSSGCCLFSNSKLYVSSAPVSIPNASPSHNPSSSFYPHFLARRPSLRLLQLKPSIHISGVMITGCTIRGYCTPQEPKEEEGDRNNIIQEWKEEKAPKTTRRA